ncbi:cyclic diguanylate phosphodiesterase [Agaricicola taiwanensis]|uniref:cyclic-guanylate-specific phosphodiesterase n=1 Tax=Agaricicola taiwanensis TaxID=591372 RepID=A0A8J2YHL1_9RHOB|nr:EAL domain-containing protein [Agaricicola taiwanensis]GGE43271.1 cyclic diguanylate phosphodiesterase [Agaricicola taiwanensis]
MAAAVISVVPLIGLNALLWLHIKANEDRQVEDAAEAIMSQVHGRLDSAMTALISLGVKDVRSCSQENRDHISQAAARAPFSQEIAIVDPEGEVRCSSVGRSRVLREISPQHDTLHPKVTMDVVDHGGDNGPTHIRLAWNYADGSSIRVVIPGSELIPPIIVGKLQSGFLTQLMLADGTLIAGRLSSQDISISESTPRVFEASRGSERYPLAIKISIPSTALLRTYQELFIYGNAGGAVMALFAVLLAWGVSRRIEGPEREIAEGIRKGQFIAYYQPVIDISNGNLLGCEALVRWRKADGTIISPAGFIALAEKSGQIYDITRSVMKRGREDLERVYEGRPELKLSFNLIAGHFASFDVINDVSTVFADSRIRMNQLVFEVTEREELPNIARARVVIARLQELGAQVALDDVGTGHGGLSYLLKLGVDQMKIDKMFVDAIGTDRYSTAIIDSLVRLASEMSMDLVAEGVETQEQVEYLRAKGVRAAQGYIFAPPLPAKAYAALAEAMCPLKQRGQASDAA